MPIKLITHIVLGYPSFEENFETLKTMQDAGVAMAEVGFPFSDPVADGPTMALANTRSLANGTTIVQCIRYAQEFAKKLTIPLIWMTYANIAVQHGVDVFVRDAAKGNAYGIIMPDMPAEESQDYVQSCTKNNVHPIFVISPNTSKERLRSIKRQASGFVYCTTRTGVTGVQRSLPQETSTYLEMVKTTMKIPRAVGFGIATKQHIKALQGYAEYAIVGSAVMTLVHTLPTKKQRLEAISRLITSLV